MASIKSAPPSSWASSPIRASLDARGVSTARAPVTARSRRDDDSDDSMSIADTQSSSIHSQHSPRTVRKPPPPHHNRPPTPETPVPSRSSRKRTAAHLDDNDDDNQETLQDQQQTAAQTHDFADKPPNLHICLCQPEQKIPRPRNAFILYRQHHQASVQAQHPGASNPEISKIIGENWRHQPDEVQAEWKVLAQEESDRHKEKYPGYRYQPRRSGRRSSIPEAPSTTSVAKCHKCGGRSMISPTTPVSGTPLRPILPPPTPSTAPFMSNERHLPGMSGLPVSSANRRNSTRHYPANIEVPATSQSVNYGGDGHDGEILPDAKRRRYTNGGYVPVQGPRTGGPPPFAMVSPYRGSFGHPSGRLMGPGTVMSPPGTVMLPPVQPQQGESLTLAPIQSTAGKSKEEIIMNIDNVRKLKVLGRISPPFGTPRATNSAGPTRGTAIAVEGDGAASVATVVKFLEEFLSRGDEHAVRTAKGPPAPEAGKDVNITDFLAVINEWHVKGQELVQYITSRPGVAKDGRDRPGCLPVILIHHYQLHASNAWACRIPIADAYQPTDHWQWIATLWRGIVGPDVTVYVRDCTAEEMGKEKVVVEVREDSKCILVRRIKGPGPVQTSDVPDSTLRRLGFEVSEWIKAVSQTDKKQEDLPQRNS